MSSVEIPVGFLRRSHPSSRAISPLGQCRRNGGVDETQIATGLTALLGVQGLMMYQNTEKSFKRRFSGTLWGGEVGSEPSSTCVSQFHMCVGCAAHVAIGP